MNEVVTAATAATASPRAGAPFGSALRESLRAYQDELLRRIEEARLQGEKEVELYLAFMAGERHFLIDGRHVGSVVACDVLEPLPIGKPWAAGAVNINGSVYLATDFDRLLGGAGTRQGKLLLLHPLLSGAALLVNGIAGLHDTEALGDRVVTQESWPDAPAWLTHAHHLRGIAHYLIDGSGLVADERFARLQYGD